MMRSLFSGVSGLRVHQTRLDVIADNIANVNTPGFKRSRTTFQDLFYQTLRGGAAPAAGGGLGGTNPQQVGLGTMLGSIDIIHSQGAAQATGNATDLMIQNEGFFILTDGTIADATTGALDTGGNRYYTRAGAFALDASGVLVNPANGLRVMGFLPDATDDTKLADPRQYGFIAVPTDAQGFSVDTQGNVRYTANDGTVHLAGQVILAKFPNPGGLMKVGQSLYVWDPNAGGGWDATNGVFVGEGSPGEDGRGTIIPSSLEMSNVDLAQEFTDMIVTQRGFQANARAISTSDEMLQELVNLRR